MRFGEWLRGHGARAEPLGSPLSAFPIPKGPAPAVSREWRQGDVFEYDHLVVTGVDGRLASVACIDGASVISQSCDASQVGRPMLQLAPVVRLTAGEADEVRAGRRPRFAPLPELGTDAFADLDFIATVAKTSLENRGRLRGVSTDEAIRSLAGAIGRKFGRFAFPDAVAECLEPTRKALASRARNPKSPLGRALEAVYAIRIEAVNGWIAPPFEVQLLVILQPGELLLDEEDVAEEPGTLRLRCTDDAGSLAPSRIAEVLASHPSPDEKHWAWCYLADAWAEQCNREAVKSGRSAVVSFSGEVVTVDDFPLSRVNRSEALDLDYVSDPLPRVQ